VPGLVDLHCHLAAGPLNPTGLDTGQLVASGTVACADAGSFGPVTIAAAAAEWAEDDTLAIRCWIHLFGTGLRDGGEIPEDDAIIEALAATRKATPALLAGIKIRLGQRDAAGDEALLTKGLHASAELGLPLIVHLTGCQLGADAVASGLRPGDVLTHAFHGRTGRVVSATGGVLPSVASAQARGVVLDLGHGTNHFSWVTLEACVREGVLPETVSTDLSRKSLHRQPLFDLATAISKMVAAGIPEERALIAGTYRPADLLGIPLEFSRSCVVLRKEQGPWLLADAEGERRQVPWVFRPVLVYRADRYVNFGAPVFRA
jgi:dihydroorotase